ncbi:MAG: sigma 54-interacting transcriptional regulator, partial [Gemmatimonadota bacterium]|nr:sigma 54-interacting transcriptional regulator [Gemmatimonadota bacterium]
ERIVEANARAEELLGYPHEELVGLPIGAVHPDELPRLLAFAREVFRVGHGFTGELGCVTKEGRRIEAEITAAPLEVDGRRLLAASVRDVSARLRAERELKAQKERLERTVEERTRELRDSRDELHRLLQLNQAILGSVDAAEMFDAITEVLERSIPLDRTALMVHRPERATIELLALSGATADIRPWELGAYMTAENSTVYGLVENPEPIHIPDVRHVATPFERRLSEVGLRSMLVAPLLAGTRVIGALGVGSLEPDRFDETDEAFLKRVAGQVAHAVEKALAFEEISDLKDRLEQENLYLQEEIKTEHNFEEIVGAAEPLKRALRAVETVAPTEANVLICGETGTGKELIARAVHDLSARSSKPLVKVNCAAIPAGLVESEFFGHEKGAFTGAVSKKIGRFELAHGGTIFLDEIGDLPLDLQSKLLRVLQEGEFERIGATRTVRVDVRVIAATNRDLEAAVADGRFRPDLFYRLNVFPIDLPPLRERAGDVRLLVHYFVGRFSRKLGKDIRSVPPSVLRRLEVHAWPGNVRELQNVVERAVIQSRGPELELGSWFGAGDDTRGTPPLELDEVQREHI